MSAALGAERRRRGELEAALADLQKDQLREGIVIKRTHDGRGRAGALDEEHRTEAAALRSNLEAQHEVEANLRGELAHAQDALQAERAAWAEVEAEVENEREQRTRTEDDTSRAPGDGGGSDSDRGRPASRASIKSGGPRRGAGGAERTERRSPRPCGRGPATSSASRRTWSIRGRGDGRGRRAP